MADPTFAYAILASIIAVILGAIFYLQAKANQGQAAAEEEERLQRAAAVRRPAGNRRQTARDRLRATLAERRGEELPPPDDDEQQQVGAAGLHAEDSEEEEDDDAEGASAPKGKMSKKKAAKLQMKAEKRAMRLAEEKEREEKRKRDELKAEEEKKKEEEEAAEEAKRLEEERRIQEERERKEQEEYEKMKAMFSVEESGFDQNNDEDAEKDLLRDFVEHIKREKVVVLEELAARFRLKTQAAINRLQDLLAEGTLTGVLDDRGKFIYISVQELEDIAKFIRQRGRVTLADLSEASGTLISLSPDTACQA